MKFFLVTFGCKVNQYETQALREAWQAQGAVECATAAEADLVCVNSCAITGKGERDARNAVYRLRREAPHARIVLTGCAAKLVDDFRPRPGVACARPDIILPQTDKARLLRLADIVGNKSQIAGQEGHGETEANAGHNAAENQNTRMAATRAFPPFEIARFHRARPVLKVQDGCAHRCTYCIVPLTRGTPTSRAPAAIIAEARRLLDAGHAELMISGINLSQYGRDRAEWGDFWSMLRQLDTALVPDFAGKARLRISSLEPSQLVGRNSATGQGLETLAACSLLCPHLHISLQHTSPHVLKRMGRGHYGVEQLYRAVEHLRGHWPRMGLGADLLVGFPGESEADVERLLRDVAALPLTYAHVFPYSARPGTAAANFPNQIPRAEKEARAKAVREAVARRQQAFLRAQLACDDMLLAPDMAVAPTAPADSDSGTSPQTATHGVNQYYADCELEGGTPTQSITTLAGGLIPVRPLSIKGTRLLVEPRQD